MFKKVLIDLSFLAAIIITTFIVSFFFGTWFGYPQGADALFHLFKTKYILANWPHHHWWSIWAGGMPLLLYYPPLPYFFLILIKITTGFPLELLLTILSVLAIALSALAIYLLALRLTGSRIFSFIPSFLYISSPSVWESSLSAGVYMRTLAMPFFILSLYSSIRFWQEFELGFFNQKFFALTSFFLGLTLLIHQHVALVGFATLFFLTLFTVKGKILAKLEVLAKIIIVSLALSASFWLPLFLFFPKNPTISWVTPFGRQLIPLLNVAPLPSLGPGPLFPTQNYLNFARLSPFLLPLGLLLTLLTIFLKTKRLMKDDFQVRILKFCGWMTLLWLIYSTGSLLLFSNVLPLVNQAYSLLGTHGATWFLPIFISLAIGILFVILPFKNFLARLLLFSVLIFLVGMFLKEQHQGITKSLKVLGLPNKIGSQDFTYLKAPLSEKVKEQQEENFRLGFIGDTKASLYFNNQFPNFAQTGHYFGPGVLNFDLYFYLQSVLWQRRVLKNETLFLLDWWAIKPILSQANAGSLNLVDLEPITQSQEFNLYSYKSPSPLFAPTKAATMLVIGTWKSYQESFFRSLALGNINSRVIIPILGKSVVEENDKEDINSFDLVFLYDYRVRSLPWAASTLEDYVKNGGTLIIESNRDLENDQTLPNPFPIQKISPSQRKGDWNFKVKPKNPYLAQEDLANFSGATYQGAAWGISEGEEVKAWAKTILTSQGKPILVEGKLGKGRVLWSGINLPFHITTYRNEKEAEFLKKIFQPVAYSPGQKLLNFEIKVKNPQERILALKENARGVLFKENYFPNWRAQGKTDSEKFNLKIYPAGPGFMFAYLPLGTKEVVFYYTRSWVEKMADFISVLTLFWLLSKLFPITSFSRVWVWLKERLPLVLR